MNVLKTIFGLTLVVMCGYSLYTIIMVAYKGFIEKDIWFFATGGLMLFFLAGILIAGMLYGAYAILSGLDYSKSVFEL